MTQWLFNVKTPVHERKGRLRMQRMDHHSKHRPHQIKCSRYWNNVKTSCKNNSLTIFQRPTESVRREHKPTSQHVKSLPIVYHLFPPKSFLLSFPRCTWGHNRSRASHFPDGPALLPDTTVHALVNNFTPPFAPGGALDGWTARTSPCLTLTPPLLASFLFFLPLASSSTFLRRNSLTYSFARRFFSSFVFASFVQELGAILL